MHGDNFVPVQFIVGTLLLGVKWPGCEADNSHIMEGASLICLCDIHSGCFAFTFRSFYRHTQECPENVYILLMVIMQREIETVILFCCDLLE